MPVSTLRDKLLEEISKIPDDSVPELFDFLYHFRVGLAINQINPQKILQFAGIWDNMSENDFMNFLNDVTTRRKNTFISRRNRETGID